MFRVIVSYSFTDRWLSLDWSKRDEISNDVVAPLLKKYAEHIEVEFVDAESFDHDITDFLLIRTKDLITYYYFMEEIRESSLVKLGYLKIRRIQLGIVDGFKSFESNALHKDTL